MHEKEKYHDRVETRTALLEQSIGHINQTLIRIERRIEGHDGDFKSIATEFKEMRQEMHSYFKWTIGMMISLTVFTISGFTGLMGVIAHGFKWI